MIKNPKLGQKVFLNEGESTIVSGKISQIYNIPSIGIDNFLYMDKKFAFSTKKKAEEYNKLAQDLTLLNEQIFKLSKQREKLASKLAKLLGSEKQRT